MTVFGLSADADSDLTGDASDLETEEAEQTVVFEPVMPYTRAGDGTLAARADSVLAVRLRSEEGIDPNSLWGPVPGYGEDQAGVEWMPVAEGDLRDIWVLFRPTEAWYLDDVISLTAGGRAADGSNVVSGTHRFRVESPEEHDARVAAPEAAIGQPDTGLPPGEVSVVPGAIADSLERGLIGPFAIGPERVYDEPQRVWLPVPAEIDPADVRLYYYKTTGDDQGWHPAEDVAGWLVPGSQLVADTASGSWVGFLVRHAGIAQLGLPTETGR